MFRLSNVDHDENTVWSQGKGCQKWFRFGVSLDQLPCTYLPDCGNVPTFLVEAGHVIRDHVDTEGLFVKSPTLSQQNALKMKLERGEGLDGLGVHEVTTLVKTFLRQLPDPLVPGLFHDPLLHCMALPPDQRGEAVQSLCFSLPAPHLSSLRFLFRLLSFIADHVLTNRMSPGNLAVVLCPCIVRLKTRSKLMTPKELQLLPQQTALVQHLICNADVIGAMTSHLHRHSLQMAEELMREKPGKTKKKKKGKRHRDQEERVGVARAVLGVLANLHFRPNTSRTVSDSYLVDGPHVQNAGGGGGGRSMGPATGGASRRDHPLLVDRGGTRRTHSCSVAGRGSQRRGRSRSSKRPNRKGKRPVRPTGGQLVNSKSMQEPLTRAWSEAITLLDDDQVKDDTDEENTSTSGDNGWSDEEIYDPGAEDAHGKTPPSLQQLHESSPHPIPPPVTKPAKEGCKENRTRLTENGIQSSPVSPERQKKQRRLTENSIQSSPVSPQRQKKQRRLTEHGIQSSLVCPERQKQRRLTENGTQSSPVIPERQKPNCESLPAQLPITETPDSSRRCQLSEFADRLPTSIPHECRTEDKPSVAIQWSRTHYLLPKRSNKFVLSRPAMSTISQAENELSASGFENTNKALRNLIEKLTESPELKPGCCLSSFKQDLSEESKEKTTKDVKEGSTRYRCQGDHENTAVQESHVSFDSIHATGVGFDSDQHLYTTAVIDQLKAGSIEGNSTPIESTYQLQGSVAHTVLSTCFVQQCQINELDISSELDMTRPAGKLKKCVLQTSRKCPETNMQDPGEKTQPEIEPTLSPHLQLALIPENKSPGHTAINSAHFCALVNESAAYETSQFEISQSTLTSFQNRQRRLTYGLEKRPSCCYEKTTKDLQIKPTHEFAQSLCYPNDFVRESKRQRRISRGVERLPLHMLQRLANERKTVPNYQPSHEIGNPTINSSHDWQTPFLTEHHDPGRVSCITEGKARMSPHIEKLIENERTLSPNSSQRSDHRDTQGPEHNCDNVLEADPFRSVTKWQNELPPSLEKLTPNNSYHPEREHIGDRKEELSCCMDTLPRNAVHHYSTHSLPGSNCQRRLPCGAEEMHRHFGHCLPEERSPEALNRVRSLPWASEDCSWHHGVHGIREEDNLQQRSFAGFADPAHVQTSSARNPEFVRQQRVVDGVEAFHPCQAQQRQNTRMAGFSNQLGTRCEMEELPPVETPPNRDAEHRNIIPCREPVLSKHQRTREELFADLSFSRMECTAQCTVSQSQGEVDLDSNNLEKEYRYMNNTEVGLNYCEHEVPRENRINAPPFADRNKHIEDQPYPCRDQHGWNQELYTEPRGYHDYANEYDNLHAQVDPNCSSSWHGRSPLDECLVRHQDELTRTHHRNTGYHGSSGKDTAHRRDPVSGSGEGIHVKWPFAASGRTRSPSLFSHTSNRQRPFSAHCLPGCAPNSRQAAQTTGQTRVNRSPNRSVVNQSHGQTPSLPESNQSHRSKFEVEVHSRNVCIRPDKYFETTARAFLSVEKAASLGCVGYKHNNRSDNQESFLRLEEPAEDKQGHRKEGVQNITGKNENNLDNTVNPYQRKATGKNCRDEKETGAVSERFMGRMDTWMKYCNNGIPTAHFGSRRSESKQGNEADKTLYGVCKNSQTNEEDSYTCEAKELNVHLVQKRIHEQDPLVTHYQKGNSPPSNLNKDLIQPLKGAPKSVQSNDLRKYNQENINQQAKEEAENAKTKFSIHSGSEMDFTETIMDKLMDLWKQRTQAEDCHVNKEVGIEKQKQVFEKIVQNSRNRNKEVKLTNAHKLKKASFTTTKLPADEDRHSPEITCADIVQPQESNIKTTTEPRDHNNQGLLECISEDTDNLDDDIAKEESLGTEEGQANILSLVNENCVLNNINTSTEFRDLNSQGLMERTSEYPDNLGEDFTKREAVRTEEGQVHILSLVDEDLAKREAVRTEEGHVHILSLVDENLAKREAVRTEERQADVLSQVDEHLAKSGVVRTAERKVHILSLGDEDLAEREAVRTAERQADVLSQVDEDLAKRGAVQAEEGQAHVLSQIHGDLAKREVVRTAERQADVLNLLEDNGFNPQRANAGRQSAHYEDPPLVLRPLTSGPALHASQLDPELLSLQQQLERLSIGDQPPRQHGDMAGQTLLESGGAVVGIGAPEKIKQDVFQPAVQVYEIKRRH